MVSIIIPVFNRAYIIEETLNSLLSQSSQDWECILVDDGSTDGLDLLINKYIAISSRFKFFQRPRSRLKGPSSCRNIGLEKAKGEYIIFLDSDDLLAPFCLEDRVKAFNENSNLDFLVFEMNTFSNKTPELNSENLEEKNTKDWLLNFIELRASWQVTSPIYKKKFINNIGGFEEELCIFEDLLLATKVLINSYNYKVYKNVDCFYRNNESYYKKHKDITYNIKIIHNYEKLLKIYDSFLMKNGIDLEKKEKIKKYIFNGYISIFNSHIIPFFPKLKEKNKRIIYYLYKNSYIKIVKFVKLLIVNSLLPKIYKIKNVGFYRLINLFIK